MGGIFGSIFGGQKDARQTNTTTTTQTDQSKNLGEGSTLVESGGTLSVQTADPDVAKAAFSTVAGVVSDAFTANAAVTGGSLLFADNTVSDLFGFLKEARADDATSRQQNLDFANAIGGRAITAAQDLAQPDTANFKNLIGAVIVIGVVIGALALNRK